MFLRAYVVVPVLSLDLGEVAADDDGVADHGERPDRAVEDVRGAVDGVSADDRTARGRARPAAGGARPTRRRAASDGQGGSDEQAAAHQGGSWDRGNASGNEATDDGHARDQRVGCPRQLRRPVGVDHEVGGPLQVVPERRVSQLGAGSSESTACAHVAQPGVPLGRRRPGTARAASAAAGGRAAASRCSGRPSTASGTGVSRSAAGPRSSSGYIGRSSGSCGDARVELVHEPAEGVGSPPTARRS